MTRKQGFRLMYLAFESEDSHASQTWYGPAQKIIHFLPLTYETKILNKPEIFDLGELPSAGWINRKGEYETISNVFDNDEYGSMLVDRFSILLDYLDTNIGKASLIHTIAHNNLITNLLQSRLDTWEGYIDTYVFGKREIIFPIDDIKINWPSMIQKNFQKMVEEVEEISWYETQYNNEYREIQEKLFNQMEDWGERLILITQQIDSSYKIERLFFNTRIEATNFLSSEISFDGVTLWDEVVSDKESLSKNTEAYKREIFRIGENVDAIIEMLNLVPDIPSHIDNINKSVQDIKEQAEVLKSTMDSFSNPIPTIFRYGIECGSLALPEEGDPRYLIVGMTQGSLKSWMLFLKEKEFSYKQLPTASKIKGLLRRKVGFAKDPEKESSIIKDTFDQAKTVVKSFYQ